MPKSVGFSPSPSFQAGADGAAPKPEPTTEMQLKRARLQIAQLKAENIRLRRKVKLSGKPEAAAGGPAHKSIESSLCNMEPSPATSITPMPAKRRLRKVKKAPEAAAAAVPAVSSQPQPSTITPAVAAKPLRVKKARKRSAKLPEPAGNISNASGEKGEKKNAFKRKADLVKAQLKKDVEATLKRGGAVQKDLKNSKSFKEHIQYLKTEIKG